MHRKGCSCCARKSLKDWVQVLLTYRPVLRCDHLHRKLDCHRPPYYSCSSANCFAAQASPWRSAVGEGGSPARLVVDWPSCGGKGRSRLAIRQGKSQRLVDFSGLAGAHKVHPRGVPRPCETRRRGAGRIGRSRCTASETGSRGSG